MNNSYSNTHIIRLERTIFQALNYNIINRDDLLIDEVGIYLESLKNIVITECFDLLKRISFDVLELTFQNPCLYRLSKLNKTLLCAAIINTAFILITKTVGPNVFTIKLQLIAQIKLHDLNELTQKVLKNSLGKDTYKKYDF